MGMDSAPASAYVISEADLNSLCPKEFGEFLRLCKESPEEGIDGVAQQWDKETDVYEDDDDANQKLNGAWSALHQAFADKTRVGDSELELELCYYNADDGGQYDDLEDGAFFVVWGCTMLTPAAENIRDKLEEKRWTIYG
jgi:hypothetical protein